MRTICHPVLLGTILFAALAACASAPSATTPPVAPSPAGVAERQPQAPRERLELKVRADFFAGMTGDDAAFARAMKVCDDALAANADDAEALVWRGAGHLFESGMAYRKGDMATGGTRWGRGLGEMDRAVALDPGRPGCAHSPRRRPARRRPPHPRCRRGTHALRARRGRTTRPHCACRSLTWTRLSTHAREELFFGLADANAQLGDDAKARSYFERLVRDCPTRSLLPYARAWLSGSKPDTSPRLHRLPLRLSGRLRWIRHGIARPRSLRPALRRHQLRLGRWRSGRSSFSPETGRARRSGSRASPSRRPTRTSSGCRGRCCSCRWRRASVSTAQWSRCWRTWACCCRSRRSGVRRPTRCSSRWACGRARISSSGSTATHGSRRSSRWWCGFAVIGYERLRGRLVETEERLRDQELSHERALRLAADAQLSSLESRIRPHFLFNSLNAVLALIPEDPKRAEAVLERITALLRASLRVDPSGLVPLREEMALVTDYLEIRGGALRGASCAGRSTSPQTSWRWPSPPSRSRRWWRTP